MRHMTCDMWDVTCDMWHVTRDTWHVTCDKWHVWGGWTFSQNFSSLALTVCDLWYYEDLEEKDHWLTQWINELMNDEAVYRTAPATPGLLIRRVDIEYRTKGKNYMCQVSHVTCRVSRVTCHLSLTPTATATATGPSPARFCFYINKTILNHLRAALALKQKIVRRMN